MVLTNLCVRPSTKGSRCFTFPGAAILCFFLFDSASPTCSSAADKKPIRVPQADRFEFAFPGVKNAAVHLDTVHIDSVRRDAEADGEMQNREEFRFSKGTFEKLVFGSRDSDADYFRQLSSDLANRVELLGRVFDLGHLQKRKLLLAGKRDIETIRDRVSALKERFEEPLFVEKIDLQELEAWASSFVIDARSLRERLRQDPFLEESMLSKVLLHQLTPEQITEYAQRELKLRFVPFGIERRKPQRI